MYNKEYSWDANYISTDEDELTPKQIKVRRRNIRKQKLQTQTEESEYTADGLRNAWHFIADKPK